MNSADSEKATEEEEEAEEEQEGKEEEEKERRGEGREDSAEVNHKTTHRSSGTNTLAFEVSQPYSSGDIPISFSGVYNHVFFGSI